MRRVLAYQVVGCMALLVACAVATVASAETRTLRIVTYNILADSGTYTTPRPGLITPSSGGTVTNGGVLEGIGEEIVNGDPAQAIDILALQETTSNTTTVQPIVYGLNAFYGSRTNPAGYAMSTYQATESGGSPSTGNGPNALVYNTNTVQLLASVPVDPPGGTSQLGSSSGEYREVMRYEFAPAGVTPTTNNEFYIYVSHYKSGTGSSNLNARKGEATIITNNAATLPANARVLYVGDFNISTSGEASYEIIEAAPGGGIDPVNPSGNTGINWATTTTDTNILKVLTDSSTNLRYRDDMELMSSNVYNGVAGGLAYVAGTHHTFGLNGTTPYNGSVNSGSDTALNSDLTTNGIGISASQLYQYLTTASDHLPVVADYTIPTGVSCTPPTASVSGGQSICQGGSTTIQAALTGTGPWNVTWLDGTSGTNYTQNGVAASPATRTVSPSSTTTYTVTAVSDASGCPGGTSSGSAVVTVNAIPSAPTAGNNGPVCVGSTLSLTASTVSGATYSWTGPNGFTSSAQNPSVSTSATTAMAGTYSVTATVNGCTSAAGQTTVTVNAITATPSPSNNGPICSGQTLSLFANTTADSYSWTGPNSFSSSLQNPTISGATTAATGTYNLTVTSNGCTSAAGSTAATVNPIPATPTAGNNGPILAGNTLNLTANTVSGGTYNWTGPNGFTSTNQTPSIPNATSAASGTYGVTVTDPNGCTPATGSTTALVTALRITSITTQGGNILITWATTGGTTNIVQVTSGDVDGSYSTNNFADILDSQTIVTGSGDSSTNYVDFGVATNSPVMFYRVRLVP